MPNAEEIRQKMKESHKNNPTRYWLWKHLSPEHAVKLKAGSLWKKHTQERKDNMSIIQSTRLRKKATQQARLNMSKAHIWLQSWDKCHLWKWGVTKYHRNIRISAEYKIWRENVYERDIYTCQRCGDNKWWNLNPHHILNFSSYPELRFAIDNWITLCDSCHNGFHKKYGCKDNNKEQLNDYIVHV